MGPHLSRHASSRQVKKLAGASESDTLMPLEIGTNSGPQVQVPSRLELVTVLVYVQLFNSRRMLGIDTGLSSVTTVPAAVLRTTTKLMRKMAQVFILERC